MDYGITVRTALPFATAVANVRDALKAQGFGVLTEIDVRPRCARSSARTWRTT